MKENWRASVTETAGCLLQNLLSSSSLEGYFCIIIFSRHVASQNKRLHVSGSWVAQVVIWLYLDNDIKRSFVPRNLIWMEVNFFTLLPFLLLLASTSHMTAGGFGTFSHLEPPNHPRPSTSKVLSHERKSSPCYVLWNQLIEIIIKL